MSSQDKVVYQDVLTALDVAEANARIVAEKIDLTPDAATIDPEMVPLTASLDNIRAWAVSNINKIDQEETLNSFLQSLKVLMTEYSAQFEIGDAETGYGEAYGEGSVTGFKISVTKDGISAEKVIDKTVITAEDL